MLFNLKEDIACAIQNESHTIEKHSLVRFLPSLRCDVFGYNVLCVCVWGGNLAFEYYHFLLPVKTRRCRQSHLDDRFLTMRND